MKLFCVGLAVFVIGAVALVFSGCEAELDPPEITVDLSPVYMGVRMVDPSAEPLVFNLMISNRGEEELKIESLTKVGDQNCAFEVKGPDLMTLGEDESSFVNVRYQPIAVATDQVALEIKSNAHEYPLLIVPICGVAVQSDPEPADEINSCNIPPPDQPGCSTEE
jgi:hypothetical protein